MVIELGGLRRRNICDKPAKILGLPSIARVTAYCPVVAGTLVAGVADPIFHAIRARLVARLEKGTGIRGAGEPEFRLPPAMCGSLLVTIGLFIFGWTTSPDIHWIVPIIGSGIFGAG